MNEDKKTRLEKLAEKEENSQTKHSEQGIRSVKEKQQKKAEQKRTIIIIAVVVVLILAIVGIIFGISHLTSSDTEPTASEETGSAENTDIEPKGTTELFSDVRSTNNEKYAVTYELCTLGEMNTQNGFYYPTILVQIQNINDENLELESVDFSFIDEDGNVIGNVHPSEMNSMFPRIIEPGEYGYLYGNNILMGEISEDAEYTVEPILEIQETSDSAKSYDVTNTDVVYDTDTGTLKLSGDIANNTDVSDSNVFVHFVFFDDKGYLIGIESLEAGNLSAKETISFEDELMFIDYAEDIASWEAYSFRQ